MRGYRKLPSMVAAAGTTCAALVLFACGGGGGGGGPPGNDGDGGGGSGGGVPPPPALPTGTVSLQTAYVTPIAAGGQVVPRLNVGDVPNGSAYAMVGKPDGLGAIAGRYSGAELTGVNEFMTVFMTHELPATRGGVRAHGTKGAFVSQWTVDLDTSRVTEGRDLLTRVFRYIGGAWREASGTTVFDRLCSADLPASSALYNASSGNGDDGRLFLNGEEVVEGRAFAHVVGGPEHGYAYELPYLGRFSYENVVLNPGSGDTTLAVSQDDDGPGQVFVYIGTKRKTGNAAELAGQHDGKSYGVRVTDGGSNDAFAPVTRENRGAINGRFEPVDVSDAALGTGANLQAVSVARAVTGFARPEDSAWDPRNPRVFYRATTGQTFDGTTQTEDAGDSERLSAAWWYDPAAAGASWFEAGRRYYLGTLQAHTRSVIPCFRAASHTCSPRRSDRTLL
jgi:hypothetical protein